MTELIITLYILMSADDEFWKVFWKFLLGNYIVP